ncbi:hypothetical protein [Arthrobacter agilis]|uniref:hypothetical protein n=1 Tax=Arthrobacter agilis TaxID=37921 RepID=UPI00278ADC4C|nr:hypothetical protein [Arthrobacter agilis]MDQ0734754.1 hypothetical protein [Arthrobacter agilis]
MNEAVTVLAGCLSVDADVRVSSEAVMWIRHALEDVMATCTGLHISSYQDAPARNLRKDPLVRRLPVAPDCEFVSVGQLSI